VFNEFLTSVSDLGETSSEFVGINLATCNNVEWFN
jgi:hypothetical protein